MAHPPRANNSISDSVFAIKPRSTDTKLFSFIRYFSVVNSRWRIIGFIYTERAHFIRLAVVALNEIVVFILLFAFYFRHSLFGLLSHNTINTIIPPSQSFNPDFITGGSNDKPNIPFVNTSI